MGDEFFDVFFGEWWCQVFKEFWVGDYFFFEFSCPPFFAIAYGNKGVYAIEEVAIADEEVTEVEYFNDVGKAFLCLLNCCHGEDAAVFEFDGGSFDEVAGSDCAAFAGAFDFELCSGCEVTVDDVH